MGIYKKLLQRIIETRIDLLSEFPEKVLQEEALDGFRKDDVYFCEQIDKQHPVNLDLPLPYLEKRLYDSLLQLKTDDFHWIFKKISGKIELDPNSINQGYNELAKKGNVSGLEAIVNLTGITPNLAEGNVLKGYESLISQARLEAADYLRQLSQIPISFSEQALQVGYQVAFMSRKYSLLLRLKRIGKSNPKISEDLVEKRFREAVDESDFKSASLLVKIFEIDSSNMPYDSSDATVEYDEKYYQLAVYSSDSLLVSNICKKRGKRINEAESKIFLEDAFLRNGSETVNTILECSPDYVPGISILTTSYFLFDHPELKDKIHRQTGIPYSKDIALFAKSLVEGDFEKMISVYDSSKGLQDLEEAKVVYKVLKC
jgi:hypothetical protein